MARRYRGTPDQHRKAATRIAKTFGVAIKRGNAGLRSGDCAAALDYLVDAAQIRGQYGEERTWSGKGHGWVRGLKALRKLQTGIAVKCVR